MRTLGTVVLVVVLLAGCNVDPTATPYPFAIERGPFEPTLNPANCSTVLCCTDCPAIPVVRVITGDTLESHQRQRVRLFGIEAPDQGQPCFQEARERLRELAGKSVRVQFGSRQGD